MRARTLALKTIVTADVFPVIFGLLKASGMRHFSRVSEPVAPAIVISLYSAVGLLFLLVAMMVGISRRLTRIERRLAAGGRREEVAAPSLAETPAGGTFDTFLNEDPARRLMSKGEQFAAYRRWRHENGLNWSPS